MISYDTLDFGQKQIFLDIACFFIGTDLRIASYMWDACGFYPKEGIVVLNLMSLIKVGENHELIMHDQLRDLGREIVCLKAKNKLRNYSRLWDPEEALQLLKEHEATKKIEAIFLSKGRSEDSHQTTDRGDNILMGKEFKKLKNLRFIEASGTQFSGDFENSMQQLKWLQWWDCRSTFEANNFHMKELAVLDLMRSKISDKWKGWSFIMMAKKLKYLDLTLCESLEKTSFLSAFENLEVLILVGCSKIEQIDSSIGSMKSLVRLDLSGCWNLEALPVEVGELEALEQLLLYNSGIRQLPDSIGNLQNLEILDVGLTKIEELPNDIGRLRKLRKLSTSNYYQLGGKIRESIQYISATNSLDLEFYEKLQSLPVLPSSLTFLSATCQSHRLPTISNLTHLKELHLDKCEFLECLWDRPSTAAEESLNTLFELEILKIHGCRFMKLLDISQFNRLREIVITRCDIHEIQGLHKSEYLEALTIQNCDSIERLDLPKFRSLKILRAQWCDNLVEIEGLNRLKFLKELRISSCLIKRLDLLECESLKQFFVVNCENLIEIQGLDRLVALKEVVISYCDSIERLNLPKSKGLKILRAEDCKNMVAIQGLNWLESLEIIHISHCPLIHRLDLTKSKGLKKLHAGSCESLYEIQGLHMLEFLEVLDISRCTSFGKLPYLCCFDTLHELAINYGDNFQNIQSLGRFPSCINLWIEDSKWLAEFLDLSNFFNLQTLILSHCYELREVLGLSTSLEHLAILACTSIEILPDLSSYTNLVTLVVQDCKKLTELRGVEKLKNLMNLDISGCKSLKIIPELSRTRIFHNYELMPLNSDVMLDLEKLSR